MGFDFSSFLPQSPAGAQAPAPTGGFDFSKYTPTPSGGGTSTPAPASSAFGNLPDGITPGDISQMWSLRSNPVTDPTNQRFTDSEGNDMGLLKDIKPDQYATQLAQFQEQQKLQNAGILQASQQVGGGEGSPTQTVDWFGSAVPASFAGHGEYSPTTPQGTNAGEGSRLVSTNNLPVGSNGLINKSYVHNDPNWGPLTIAANVDQSSPGWDTFWKVAPMIPMALAGGIGAPMFAGGALTGSGAATLANSIGQNLIGNNGKFNFSQFLPTAVSAAAGYAGLPGWAGTAINAGVGLARGNKGSFDWTKFIPQGLQTIAKGLG